MPSCLNIETFPEFDDIVSALAQQPYNERDQSSWRRVQMWHPGSDVADIINITALTVNQAIGTRMKPLQGEES